MNSYGFVPFFISRKSKVERPQASLLKAEVENMAKMAIENYQRSIHDVTTLDNSERVADHLINVAKTIRDLQ